jgi:hypothetical protein
LFSILFLLPSSYIFQDLKKKGIFQDLKKKRLDEYLENISFNIRFLFFGIENKSDWSLIIFVVFLRLNSIWNSKHEISLKSLNWV